jgi:HlyD family secretion protein
MRLSSGGDSSHDEEMENQPPAGIEPVSTEPWHPGLSQAVAEIAAPRASAFGGVLKRLLPWLAVAVIAAAAFIWWRRSGTTAATTITFRAAVVQRGDVTQTVTGSGALSALTTVDVGSQVSGNILKRYADFNDPVKEGQLLAEIDPSTYEARLFQAQANLESVQAALSLKQINVKRSNDLLAKTLIAQSDNDQALAELRQQEAATKNAEAAVKSAKLDLDRCKIYSPVDGVVLKRSVDVGQTVQSNYSVATLFTIARDLSQMEIEAAISEADIGNVEAGQAVTFTVDAFAGRNFQGKVRQVRNNSTVANNVVTYPTIISADNSDLKLRPGMTANIVIATTQRTNVLRLPNAALRFKTPEGATVIAAPEGEGPSLDQMPPEIRQRLLAQFDKNGDGKLDADERKAMDAAFRARMAAAGGGGGGFGPTGGGGFGGPPTGGGGKGGPGGGFGGPRGPGSTSQRVTLYVVNGTPDAGGRATGSLQAVRAVVGVSDATNTEILSGVKEGDVIAIGTVSAQAAASTGGSNNIFGPPRPPGANKK